jgi:hypothetical protein
VELASHKKGEKVLRLIKEGIEDMEASRVISLWRFLQCVKTKGNPVGADDMLPQCISLERRIASKAYHCQPPPRQEAKGLATDMLPSPLLQNWTLAVKALCHSRDLEDAYP